MELIIAIALLGIIMGAVSTLFMIGLRNYQRESQRNLMQQEINFVADDLGTQIKQAALAPETFEDHTRSTETLILALPAVNPDEDFLYTGDSLLYDHVIYTLQEGTLYKEVVIDPTSNREAKRDPVLSNVSEFTCLYNPQSETEIISCTIRTSKDISGRTLAFDAVKTARMRNHQ